MSPRTVTDDRIDVADGDGVRVIAFDRPEVRNAFDVLMYGAVSPRWTVRRRTTPSTRSSSPGGARGSPPARISTRWPPSPPAPPGPKPGRALPDSSTPCRRSRSRCWPRCTGWGWGSDSPSSATSTWCWWTRPPACAARSPEMGVPPEAASSLLLPARMGWQPAAAVLLASEWISAHQAVEVRDRVAGGPGRHRARGNPGAGPADRRLSSTGSRRSSD